MRNMGHGLEDLLPRWFEKNQLQWVQWIYAAWQIIRCNPLTLLVLSYLSFYLQQKYKKRTVVVVGETKDYDMSYDEVRRYLNRHQVINMEVESCEHPPNVPYCYTVKHNGYYYITHENALCELAACSEKFGENVIFVERLLPVTASLAVGKQLSQTEAYEKVMSKRYHCNKGPKIVVPTRLDYFDFSTKFWGVLSTVPILLQARRYEKCSNLLSLLIILLDLNRGWMYKFYDMIFNSITQFVKINIFKERTELYDFFSIFSRRWRYSDSVRKYAYVAKPGEKMKIRWYSKLKCVDDLKIVDWDHYVHDPNDQHIFMELSPHNSHYTAHCSLMLYDDVAAVVELNKYVYVP